MELCTTKKREMGDTKEKGEVGCYINAGGKN